MSPEVEELDAIILRVYEGDFGFRASHREVLEKVLANVDKHYTVTGANKHLVLYGFRSWCSRRVTTVFNKSRGGLPFAPVVNSNRQHVPLEHALFSELEYLAKGYVSRGDAEYKQARKVARKAYDVYGKRIVVNGIDLAGNEGAAA
ncbi:MAG: hypothetical protein QM677_04960 [Microbacterium sp.]